MNRCSKCRADTTGEMTWPGESGGEICQNCWETECSASWWRMVDQLSKLGLLDELPETP